MSFSFDVKQELIAIENKPCCKFAQSYGFLLFGRSFSLSGISLMSDYAQVADAYADAVFSVSGHRVPVTCSRAGKYFVNIPSGRVCRDIFTAFGYDSADYRIRLNHANIRDDCCLVAFLRGVFLACGSVTAPEKDYHLEFSISSKTLTDEFVKLFDVYDNLEPDQSITLRPKIVRRSGTYCVYFRDSSSVEDLLALIGANDAALYMMQTKILKDVKNNVNRKVNFETANIGRSVEAAYVQIEAIRKLEESAQLDGFPPDIRQLAMLRCAEPEMSLRELGSAMRPPMSRSAVNYRMKKLLKAAEELP